MRSRSIRSTTSIALFAVATLAACGGESGRSEQTTTTKARSSTSSTTSPDTPSRPMYFGDYLAEAAQTLCTERGKSNVENKKGEAIASILGLAEELAGEEPGAWKKRGFPPAIYAAYEACLNDPENIFRRGQAGSGLPTTQPPAQPPSSASASRQCKDYYGVAESLYQSKGCSVVSRGCIDFEDLGTSNITVRHSDGSLSVRLSNNSCPDN